MQQQQMNIQTNQMSDMNQNMQMQGNYQPEHQENIPNTYDHQSEQYTMNEANLE